MATVHEPRPLHPWVAERRDRLTFAAQLWPESGDRLPATGRLVEGYGFDALFVPDHPGWGLDCWVSLAALACVTERVCLGTMVACVAYRPPLVTARAAADIDRMSGGRLVLGLGIGWDASIWDTGPSEFAALGLPFPPTPARQAALEEAIAIMRGAWGPDPFTFAGHHYSATDAQIVPPPAQPLGPPVVIAGAGERTLGQVARLADACNFGAGPSGNVATPDDARHKLAVLRRHCEAIGRPPEDVLATHFTLWLILATDEAAVAEKLRRYYPDGVPAAWAAAVVACTPEQAIAFYRSYADAGFRYFIVEINDPDDEETLTLLAEQVIPAVLATA